MSPWYRGLRPTVALLSITACAVFLPVFLAFVLIVILVFFSLCYLRGVTMNE